MDSRPRRMVVLGGAVYHPGGLESFCARAAEAVNAVDAGWTAEWWPTDAAYLNARRMAGLARRLVAALRVRRFDVVWLQFSSFADLVFLLEVKALGVPVFVTPHLGANARLQRIDGLRRLCTRLLGAADRMGILFDGQEQEIELPPALPRSMVRTFLPPITLAQPLPAKAPGPLRLMHAGRLSEGKGTFRMVALCAALRQRKVPFTAQIVGRADEATMARLRDAIATAGLGNRIELVEWLSPEGLNAALGRADVLVHLSHLDAFPLIVLEAIAAGTVPVVAEMAGARAMVAAHGGHVAGGDMVTDAADWLAAQPVEQLRRRGAAMAADVRASYRWDACALEAIAAAEATLAQRARP